MLGLPMTPYASTRLISMPLLVAALQIPLPGCGGGPDPISSPGIGPISGPGIGPSVTAADVPAAVTRPRRQHPDLAVAPEDVRPRRTDHTSLVFRGRLYVIGGKEGGLHLDDVLVTEDGVRWFTATDEAGFGQRAQHASAVFANAMWVVGGVCVSCGGRDGTGKRGDVWRSTDGAHWQRVVARAPFAARHGHSLVVHGERLWVLGGWSGGKPLSDVWSSPDGITWQRATHAAFPARSHHTALSHDGRMWVLGGWAGHPDRVYSDVWSSEDGVVWHEVADAAPYGPRWTHGATVHEGHLWVIGGQDGRKPYNDAWSSPDGHTWHKVAGFCLQPPRDQLSGNSFRGQVFAIGGECGADRDLAVVAFPRSGATAESGTRCQ